MSQLNDGLGKGLTGSDISVEEVKFFNGDPDGLVQNPTFASGLIRDVQNAEIYQADAIAPGSNWSQLSA